MSRHDRRAAEAHARKTGVQVVIFRRADGWYPLELPIDEDLSRHAERNPGTLAIEDAFGNILWRPQ
jgi:hypothetical protein